MLDETERAVAGGFVVIGFLLAVIGIGLLWRWDATLLMAGVCLFMIGVLAK